MSFTKKFISDIHKEFKEKFEFEAVEKLLSIDQDYEYDTIHKKRLIIKRVRFSGIKNNGNPILCDKKFTSGVNLILADNNKGKSSILKIIKFCLTGSDKIQQDVSSWLNIIHLEFALNDILYTVAIKMPNDEVKRLKGTLYQLSISELEKLENPSFVFNAIDAKDYLSKIEAFFFEQFDFYNLQWTTKAGQKNSVDLNTANATWKTYYSGTLNLESKDSYNLFYGGQAELCFQMLLGLKLTYPINRLKIKKEKLEYDLTLLTNKKGKKQDVKKKEIEKINKTIQQIKKELEEITKNNNTSELDKLLKKRNVLSDKIVLAQDNRIETKKNKDALIYKRGELLQIYNDSSKEIKKNKRNKDKLLKKINELKEYVDIGVFFTNLDIHSCPHCNNEVDSSKKIKEKENKECMLCDHKVEEPLSDPEIYTNKLAEHERNIKSLETESLLYKSKQEKISAEGKLVREKIKTSEVQIQKLIKEENKLIKDYNVISKLIGEVTKTTNNTKKEIELAKRLAVLEYQQEELNKDNSLVDKSILVKYINEIQLLEKSIYKLKERRLKESQLTITKLEDFIFTELQQLGLVGVEKVRIKPNFKIDLHINDTIKPLEKVTEGEILRAKLALFLSIIQLSINNNQGKHPRFLVIDSPAKEEADKKFVTGLITIIEEVNSKYGNDLQIIIGTAERSLKDVNISGEKYIVPENEFVF